MAKSRALVVAKLALLIGGPVLVIGGLFFGGVYWGDAHRAKVLEIEHDWFGLDVQVPATPSTPPAPNTALGQMLAKAQRALPPGPEPMKPSADPATPSGAAPSQGGTAVPQAAVPPANVPQPAPTPAAATGPAAVTGPTAATGAPAPSGAAAMERPAPDASLFPSALRPEIPATLEASYAKARIVSVKVLVDGDFVAAHPNWLDDVQAVIGAASDNFDTLFGVQLQLHGVVRWQAPGGEMGAEALHASLREREREGADLVLGFTGRPLDRSRFDGWSDTPGPNMKHNMSYALVFAVPGKSHQFLRATMHELAHLFGAKDKTEPGSDAWRQGSFMSYAFTRPGTAPVIDPENLKIVLERKGLDFEAQRAPGQRTAEGKGN